MRTWFVPVVVVFFVLLSTDTLSATDCYVRTDGSNVVCDGTADAPQSAQPNCAFASVLYAANNCTGDNIRIHGSASGSWYNERVSFVRSGTQTSPIVIEGYGPTKPHIGPNWTSSASTAWTYVPSDKTWWTSYSNGTPSAAYILTALPYEHERIGLVVYTDYNDLRGSANGFRISGGNYYIGPGIYYDPAASRLYVRLDATPQVTSYQQNYLDRGFGDGTNRMLKNTAEASDPLPRPDPLHLDRAVRLQLVVRSSVLA